MAFTLLHLDVHLLQFDVPVLGNRHARHAAGLLIFSGAHDGLVVSGSELTFGAPLAQAAGIFSHLSDSIVALNDATCIRLGCRFCLEHLPWLLARHFCAKPPSANHFGIA